MRTVALTDRAPVWLAGGLAAAAFGGVVGASSDVRLAAEATLIAVAAVFIVVAPVFHLFCLVVLTLPFADWKPGGSHFTLTVLLELLLALRLVLVARDLRVLRDGRTVLWALVPALILPSAFIGQADSGERVAQLTSIASFVLLAVAAAELVTKERWPIVRILLVGETAIAMVLAAGELGAGAWLLPFPGPGLDVDQFGTHFRPRGLSISPYALGGFLAMTAPVVWFELLAAIRRRSRIGVPAWATFAVAQLAVIVATLSLKSVWQVGVAAVVFLAVAVRDFEYRRLAFSLLAVLVVAGALTSSLFAARVSSPMTSENQHLRFQTITDALRMGRDDFPFGGGLAHFVSTSTARYGTQLNAYDSFAEAFADSGVLGLIALVLAAGAPLFFVLRIRPRARPSPSIPAGMFAGLVALAFVESSFWSKPTAFAAGVCLAWRLNEEAPQTAATPLTQRAALAVGATLKRAGEGLRSRPGLARPVITASLAGATATAAAHRASASVASIVRGAGARLRDHPVAAGAIVAAGLGAALAFSSHHWLPRYQATAEFPTLHATQGAGADRRLERQREAIERRFAVSPPDPSTGFQGLKAAYDRFRGADVRTSPDGNHAIVVTAVAPTRSNAIDAANWYAAELMGADRGVDRIAIYTRMIALLQQQQARPDDAPVPKARLREFRRLEERQIDDTKFEEARSAIAASGQESVIILLVALSGGALIAIAAIALAGRIQRRRAGEQVERPRSTPPSVRLDVPR